MRKNRITLIAESLRALLALLSPMSVAQADIFQWEYINPADPSLGKQQSTMIAPDGAGASAEPGSNLSNRDLTKAYLTGVDLSPYLAYDDYGYIDGYARSDLTSVTLSQADLSYASFAAATLTGADFAGAEVRWANFDRFDQYGYSFSYGYGTGLTLPQLASTASYAAHDLSGIRLGLNNLAGANFSGFNLTEARFAGADLTNVNFSNANLTGASVSGSSSGVKFTNATVRGATLWDISKAQLYSTASYQADDLAGLYFYSAQTGWNFAGKNLSQSYFHLSMSFANSNFTAANLTGTYLSFISFQNADLSQANLTDANFSLCKLTGANLAGAEVRGANFTRDVATPVSGLSPAQLASTASYLAHDLTGMQLRYNVLTGMNLAGQNLTNVDFTGASLEGADFADADVRGTRLERDISRSLGGITAAQIESTASYLAHDLTGIGLAGNNFAGINLAGQNLTHAIFESEAGYGTDLSGANLSQANMTNAVFGITTLAGATLIEANLAGTDLHLATLTTANFTHANLSGANFSGYVIVIQGGDEGGGGYYNAPGADLGGANLTGANLTNASFSGTYDFFGFPFPGANFTGANLTGADARGANFQFATMDGATTINLIQSNGHIAGVDLAAGTSLVVRDYDANPSVPQIVVEQHLAMSAAGTLRLEFDADAWDSTISFAPGIPVALGGTLELNFASDVDVATQNGRTIDLFDWTGVAPTGTFAVSSPYAWDLSKLYTTGEVTLGTPLAGDFNANGGVENGDLTLLLNNWGSSTTPAPAGWIAGLLTAPAIDNDELTALLNSWGAGSGAIEPGGGSGSVAASRISTTVPEPSALALAVFGAMIAGVGCWRIIRHDIVNCVTRPLTLAAKQASHH